MTSRFVRRCNLTSYNLGENEYKLAVPQPRTEFYKRSLSYSGSVLWNGLPLEVRQLTSPSIFKGKLGDKFWLTNNLISDILFLHTASLKSRCFLFIFIILVFYLSFRLVRKLVFLYLNVNVYLMEIPCLNKVTYLPTDHDNRLNRLGFVIEAHLNGSKSVRAWHLWRN